MPQQPSPLTAKPGAPAFIRRVARTLQRYGMLRRGERVLVAVSGGPDSVAMVWALQELRRKWSAFSYEMVLAHFNHQLRDDAAEDVDFCRRLAGELGLELVCGKGRVALQARRSRCSPEETARKARYRFLERAADRRGCTRIALGHTKNDQAETLLLRMLRGSGTRGLAAIYPVVDGRFIRPLLEVTRQEVLGFLEERQLAWRHDSTNDEWAIPRNRLRHQVLPLLEREFNPSIVETLARTAAILREEEDWMDGEAHRALEAKTGPVATHEALSLPVTWLASLHPALARRIIRASIRQVRGDLRRLGARHIEEVLGLTAPGKSGRCLALPGVDCARAFDRLWFRPASADRPGRGRADGKLEPEVTAEDGYNGYEYELPVPGCLEVPEAGGTIIAEEVCTRSLPAARGLSVVVALPRNAETASGLSVRNPRRGDRFRPLGASGSKPLARYLMEHRVERGERWKIPLVVHGERDVLWVVGHAVSEHCRVHPQTRRMLHLSWMEG